MPLNLTECEIVIVKVHKYRTAMVHPNIPLPRKSLSSVEDALPQNEKDNHIVVIARISKDHYYKELAFWFSDSTCYLGLAENVILEKW